MQEIDLLYLVGFDRIAIFVIASILLVLLGFGLGYFIFYKNYQRAAKLPRN